MSENLHGIREQEGEQVFWKKLRSSADRENVQWLLQTNGYRQLVAQGYCLDPITIINSDEGDGELIMPVVSGFKLMDVPPEYKTYITSLDFAKTLATMYQACQVNGVYHTDGHAENIMFDTVNQHLVMIDYESIVALPEMVDVFANQTDHDLARHLDERKYVEDYAWVLISAITGMSPMSWEDEVGDNPEKFFTDSAVVMKIKAYDQDLRDSLGTEQFSPIVREYNDYLRGLMPGFISGQLLQHNLDPRLFDFLASVFNASSDNHISFDDILSWQEEPSIN